MNIYNSDNIIVRKAIPTDIGSDTSEITIALTGVITITDKPQQSGFAEELARLIQKYKI